MRTLLLRGAMFVAALAYAQDMPTCDKARLGQFWPEEANSDRVLAVQLARNGELQVCSHRRWHYQWMQPAVTVQQLRASRGKAADHGEADRQKTFSDLKLRRTPPPPRAEPETSPTAQ